MSVVSGALLPAAPALVRSLGGRLDPAAEPRAAAMLALRELLAPRPERIVVIAQGDHAERFEGTQALGLFRLGGLPQVNEPTPEGAALLPIPLAIAAAMLSEAGWSGDTSFALVPQSMTTEEAAAIGASLQESEESIGLLLLGNGSACSTPKAPGSFHPESEKFNLDLVMLLSEGRSASISAAPAVAFDEQLSDVRAPLQVLSGVAARVPAEIHLAEEFQGVFYVCANFRFGA